MLRVNNKFLNKHKWLKNRKNRLSWKRWRKRVTTSSGCTFCSRLSKCSMDCTPSKSLALLTITLTYPTRSVRISLAAPQPLPSAKLLSCKTQSIRRNAPRHQKFNLILPILDLLSLSLSSKANWTRKKSWPWWNSIKMRGRMGRRLALGASIFAWLSRQMLWHSLATHLMLSRHS